MFQQTKWKMLVSHYAEYEPAWNANEQMTQYLLAFVQDRDNVIMRWARETIDSDLIAQNSAEDFQSWKRK